MTRLRNARRQPTATPGNAGDDRAPLPGEELPRVLVVDDNTANLAAFEATLSDPGVGLVLAASGAEAMRHLLTGTFAAILLDINMPTLDGLETASLIRRRERCRDIPIIFITAYQPDQTQLLRGYATGAVDYLVKPVSPEILRSKVRVFVELFRKTRQVEWQARQLRAVNLRLQQEMTQRQQAERDAAFEREERQRVALESIADAVITTDDHGRVTSLNPVAEQLTGLTAGAARGASIARVLRAVPEADVQPPDAAVARCIAERRSIRSRVPAMLAGGDAGRYIEYGVAPVHDRVGTVVGVVLIVHDVTERHSAELERARALMREQSARKAAEEASRAREEFLAVISHELRTPLNAIVGWTQVLRSAAATAQQRTQAVEAINRSAMAQKKLIEDLLDMSRIVNGKIELNRGALDLCGVVGAAVSTVRPLADEKRVALICSVPEAATPVEADRDRLQQVLWNLLANAVKFTPSGGQVDVRLERDGDLAVITVCDTGEGIDAQFLPHVFEAFRQADSTTTRRQGGLGLGLAIARTLVTMHGGTITAESDGPGCGARFTVVLPVSLGELGRLAGNPPEAANDRFTGSTLHALRVLIVDDDANTRDMLRIVVTESGAEAQAAGSASEALALLERWRPDVILSDISMPGEDGYSLIRRVRSRAADAGGAIPAVAITAMASVEDRDTALAAGFQAHLPKPLQFDALVHVIADLVGARPAALASAPIA